MIKVIFAHPSTEFYARGIFGLLVVYPIGAISNEMYRIENDVG
jgi:hypothetical protein